MSRITITLQNSSNYDDIRIEQDNRMEEAMEQSYYSKHVDSSRSIDNIYWGKNTSIKEFYEKTFQNAYIEYLEKAKKNYPNIFEKYKETYFDQLLAEQLEVEEKKSELKKEGLLDAEINKQIKAKPHIAYQTIIQLGSRNGPFGIRNLTDERKLQIKKIMGEFMTRWENEYTHMKLINVAVHLDEIGNDGKSGTVHMHITYCPVADNYTKGQKVQNSLTRALKQMGYQNEKKEDETQIYAIAKWQNDMRDLLENIIAKYGYERTLSSKHQEKNENDNETRKNYVSDAEENVKDNNILQKENCVDKIEGISDSAFARKEIRDNNTLLKRQHELLQHNRIQIGKKYHGLKDAISDGIACLKKTEEYLNQNGIEPENIGCNYGLELECLQEHFNALIVLLEYYQKEHREICNDIIDAFIYNLKKEAMCIGINEDEKLYTVTEEVLITTKQETI